MGAADRELLEKFWMLSGCRPAGMAPGRIPISEIVVAYGLTWLTCPVCVFVGQVLALDEIWMEDYVRKERAKQAQARN